MLPRSILAMSDWLTPAKFANSRCERFNLFLIWRICRIFGSWGTNAILADDIGINLLCMTFCKLHCRREI